MATESENSLGGLEMRFCDSSRDMMRFSPDSSTSLASGDQSATSDNPSGRSWFTNRPATPAKSKSAPVWHTA